MTWNETCAMDQKMLFVTACIDGSRNISSLCRHFGISRKTGYKWLNRYRAEGPVGLTDRSRTPYTNCRAVPPEVIDQVLAVRHKYPTWGPRKVRAWLQNNLPDQSWPAASTIGNIFDRAGLTRPRKRRRRAAAHTRPFARCAAPNDVWCADFKGWFTTGDHAVVNPLTITDACSRYLIRCHPVDRTGAVQVWPVFDAAFREHGLPRVLRTDNGAPFASCAIAGLSRLSVKLIQAGVLPERVQPGKPQQNGRHERMHLTLKQDTASPPAATLAEQTRRFDHFRRVFNHQRPHEALGQKPPASVYQSSSKVWDGVLRPPGYTVDAVIRMVRQNGEIKWRGNRVFISEVLAKQPVGLTEIDDDVWLVRYGPIILGTLNGRGKIHKIRSGSPARPEPCRHK